MVVAGEHRGLDAERCGERGRGVVAGLAGRLITDADHDAGHRRT